MIDYLFVFPDEATARACLPTYVMPEGWDESSVLLVDVGVGYSDGPVDAETGEAIRLPVWAAGRWVLVSEAERVEALWQVPGCMREADREAAGRGEPYVLRDRFSAEQLARPFWVTPVPAGSAYPFATLG